MRVSVLIRVNDTFRKILALLLLAIWNAALDMIVTFALKHADDTEKLIRESKPLQKAQTISHGFARHGNRDKDAVFSFAARGSHKCASRVLAEIVSCAVFFGKLVGTMILTLSFVGVDISTNLVVLGMSMLISGLFAISNTAKATSALIPLSISNPFYVGEIVRTISIDLFSVWPRHKSLRLSPCRRFLLHRLAQHQQTRRLHPWLALSKLLHGRMW